LASGSLFSSVGILYFIFVLLFLDLYIATAVLTEQFLQFGITAQWLDLQGNMDANLSG
jgi:hypothetical protein